MKPSRAGVRRPARQFPVDKDWQKDWTPKDLVKVDGYLWPAIAEKYRHRYFKHAGDMQYALELHPDPRFVLQAGGNVGVWANWLSERGFETWTAEPDPMNFYCLARNAWRPNVRKFQCALGEGGDPMALNFHSGNIGAHNLIPGSSGDIAQLRIDDLGMPRVDLIVLDVEGWEWPALRGARGVLNLWKPVVMLEDRGHSEKLGQGSLAEIAEWLRPLGYSEATRVAKDVIFTAQ